MSVTHLSLHVTDVGVDPPQNEKLGVERAFSEDSANKLRKVNTELRVGREERFGRPVCGAKCELTVVMFAGRARGNSGSVDVERYRNHKGRSAGGPQKIVLLVWVWLLMFYLACFPAERHAYE